jgi:hypothetical protein
MGRPGSALGNAVIASWNSTLEFELRSLEHFAAGSAARVPGLRVDRGLQPPPARLSTADDVTCGLREQGQPIQSVHAFREPQLEAALIGTRGMSCKGRVPMPDVTLRMSERGLSSAA